MRGADDSGDWPAFAPRPPLRPGDRVRVATGPFDRFEGVVQDIDSQHQQVRVLVTIFGRPTPIEVPEADIERR